MPAFSAAVSIRRASAALRPSGFVHRTAFLCLQHRRTASSCRWFGRSRERWRGKPHGQKHARSDYAAGPAGPSCAADNLKVGRGIDARRDGLPLHRLTEHQAREQARAAGVTECKFNMPCLGRGGSRSVIFWHDIVPQLRQDIAVESEVVLALRALEKGKVGLVCRQRCSSHKWEGETLVPEAGAC